MFEAAVTLTKGAVGGDGDAGSGPPPQAARSANDGPASIPAADFFILIVVTPEDRRAGSGKAYANPANQKTNLPLKIRFAMRLPRPLIEQDLRAVTIGLRQALERRYAMPFFRRNFAQQRICRT
jgi:hypothetical protein